MNVDDEGTFDSSSDETGSIEDIFALAADVMADVMTDDADVYSIQNSPADSDPSFQSSPTTDSLARPTCSNVNSGNNNATTPITNPSSANVSRTPTPIPVSPSWLSDDDELNNSLPFAPAISRHNHHHLTVILSSDDEPDGMFECSAANSSNRILRPNIDKKKKITSRAKHRTSNTGINSSNTSSEAGPSHQATASKRKRKSPTRQSTEEERSRAKRNVSRPNTSSAVASPPSDPEIELLTISNSVSDITLANIEQLEADELLARQLQSAYDEEMDSSFAVGGGNARRPCTRPSLSTRRSARSSRVTLQPSTSNTAQPSSSSSSSTATATQRPPLRRSARTTTSFQNAPTDRRSRHARNHRGLDTILYDDDLEAGSFFGLFANPRRLAMEQGMELDVALGLSSFVEDFFTYDVVNGGSGTRQRVPAGGGHRRVRHPVPADVAAYINRTEQRDSFESVLEMVDRLGEADTGLRQIEIETYTTQKIFLASEGNNDVCSVCMAEYEANDCLLILPCVHNYHKACITRWLKNKPTCPICRVDVRN